MVVLCLDSRLVVQAGTEKKCEKFISQEYLSKGGFFFCAAKKRKKKMHTRKRTAEQVNELLAENLISMNAHLDALVVQNKKLCALISQLSESVFEIETAVVVKKEAPQPPPPAGAAVAVGKLLVEHQHAEDSNSMPPPVPHAPFPDEKLNEI